MTTARDAQKEEIMVDDEKTFDAYVVDSGNAEIFFVTGLSRISTFFVVFSLGLAFALTMTMLVLTVRT